VAEHKKNKSAQKEDEKVQRSLHKQSLTSRITTTWSQWKSYKMYWYSSTCHQEGLRSMTRKKLHIPERKLGGLQPVPPPRKRIHVKLSVCKSNSTTTISRLRFQSFRYAQRMVRPLAWMGKVQVSGKGCRNIAHTRKDNKTVHRPNLLSAYAVS
jgi:hypothetical protein